MFYKRTKRQKDFLKVLKYTKKKFNCDREIEKVQGRYEFNVYNASEKNINEYLEKFNIEIISVNDENDNFVVVREIKGERKWRRYILFLRKI